MKERFINQKKPLQSESFGEKWLFHTIRMIFMIGTVDIDFGLAFLPHTKRHLLA